MSFGRPERLWRTLRFRIAIWNAGVLLVLGLVLLLGLREGMRLTLLRELDHRLAGDSAEVVLLLEHPPEQPQWTQDELDRKAESHKSDGWFAQVFTADGRLLWTSGEVPAGLPIPTGSPDPDAAPGYRCLGARHEKGRLAWVVRVGVSLAEMHTDLGRLDRLLVIAGVVLLAVAPGSAYWLAGRATRPVGKMIRAARSFRASRLDERLPIQGSGDELDHLATTINGFLDRLADYLARKRDFLANAAHELRSPLAALRGAIEVALQHDRTSEEYHEILDGLAEQCAALTTLVNQLLLLAESDAGQIQPGDHRVDLSRVAEQAVAMFEGVAESRGVALRGRIEPGLELPGRAHHLRQVVTNLVDNALKYTPAGGHVEVRLHREPARRVLILEVEDTGAGIPAEDIGRVCDRFYRVDRSRRRDEDQPPGTGLGLSICQAIVEAYGGQLTIRSAVGVGTTVVVVLPATRHLTEM